ncbi:MAG: hypothetical protein RAK22_02305 [Nanoarchaeota archaeon]|nr:hypothetical protein [Nanoarchaeota archaeon]
MEIKVLSEHDDKYLDRKIVNFSVKLEPNENIDKNAIKTKLMEGYKEGFPIIYTIKGVYGIREAKGVLHIYKNEDSAKKLLPKYVLIKNGVIHGEEKESTEKSK